MLSPTANVEMEMLQGQLRLTLHPRDGTKYRNAHTYAMWVWDCGKGKGTRPLSHAEQRTAQTLHITPKRAMDEYDEAVLFTYSLLESRLERLEYLLGASTAQADEKPKPKPKPLSIADRVRRIEQSLQQLAGKTALLDNVNKLCTRNQGSSSCACIELC
jgi:hypothetical protein